MPWFGRKKPDADGAPTRSLPVTTPLPPSASVPLEEQIATLAGFGLRTGPDPVGAALASCPRAALEARPYAAVLALDGWCPDLLGLGDLEWLDGFDEYAPRIRAIAAWTGQAHRLGDITTHLESDDDDIGQVSVQVDGTTFDYEPAYRGDWADGMFLGEVAGLLAAPGRTVDSGFFDGSFVLVHLPEDRDGDFYAFTEPFRGLD